MFDDCVNMEVKGVDSCLLRSRPHPKLHPALLWVLPERIGSGSYVCHPLSCQSSVTFSDCYHPRRVSARMADDCNFCTLVFGLRGASHHRNSCFTHGFTLGEGDNCLYASADPLLTRESEAHEELKTVVIRMPRSRLGQFQDLDSYCFVNRNTLKMKRLLDQMLHCRSQGAVRHFFLESKALELVALKLDMLSEHHSLQGCLSPADYQAVMRVKETLLQSLDAPPDMTQLCQIAGMSHPKLTKSFKCLNGMTVFAWIRQQRLQLSCDLITAQDMNLTTIAYTLGYSSSSHFSREFHKYYGICPSQYLERRSDDD